MVYTKTGPSMQGAKNSLHALWQIALQSKMWLSEHTKQLNECTMDRKLCLASKTKHFSRRERVKVGNMLWLWPRAGMLGQKPYINALSTFGHLGNRIHKQAM